MEIRGRVEWPEPPEGRGVLERLERLAVVGLLVRLGLLVLLERLALMEFEVSLDFVETLDTLVCTYASTLAHC